MKSNKLLLSLSAFIMAAPAIVISPSAGAAESAHSYNKMFKDVSSSHPYYDIIHTMVEQNIISGYEDGTFRPNETITRKQAATLINRAVDVTKTLSYLHKIGEGKELIEPKDVSIKSPSYLDIKAVLNAGIMELDKNGNFNPNEALTRGEMAKALVYAFDLIAHQLQKTFKDVSNTYSVYADVLYVNHITTGYEDGTFRENNELTRAHFALFMYRAINVEDYWTAEEAELYKMLNEERRLQAEGRLTVN